MPDLLTILRPHAPRPPRAAREVIATVSPALSWATWPNAVVLLSAALILRLVYSLWFSPWQLVGDEAYYWVQAHHLDWGYTEKGPLLPWMIAGACRLFGDTEFAVRLPLIVCYGFAAWGVGRLAMAASRGDQRVGFFAVALFLLLPAFTANAQISTQDGPLIALWIALTAASLRLVRRWRARENTWAEWILLWALLGVGFLLKQSVFTFLPGLGLYWLLFRREMPIRPVLFAQQTVGVLVLLAVSSPMLVWNANHSWPMLAHTLGHLGAGGDQAAKVNSGNPLLWEANTIGSFVGAFGPAVVLMVWATIRAWRNRHADTDLWRAQALMIASAWTTTAIFILLSLKKPVVPSWPLPNMGPIVVVVAQLLVDLRAADPRATDFTGSAGKSVLPAIRRARAIWQATLVYGVAATILLAFPTVLRFVPVYGQKINDKVLARLSGHKERFAPLDTLLASLTTPDGRAPLPVARNYDEASLATFYLRGHPPVATWVNYTGIRPSNFDHWPETNLSDPRQRGRLLVFMLAGKNNTLEDRGRLEAAFELDDLRQGPDPRYLIAGNYRGPRPRARAEAHP